MNGGHYMTRGHVILRILYIKMHRMSRTILELAEDSFGYANGPPPMNFLPCVDRRTLAYSWSVAAAAQTKDKRGAFPTHPLPACRTYFIQVPPAPRTGRLLPKSN